MNIAAIILSKFMIAIFYFPGVFLGPKSLGEIQRIHSNLFPGQDEIEQFSVIFDVLTPYWECVESTFQRYKTIFESKAVRIIFVGESFGLSFAADLRSAFKIDALIIGSSPGPSKIYRDDTIRRKLHESSFQRNEHQFSTLPGGTKFIQNYYAGEMPVKTVWQNETNAIIFTGVRLNKASIPGQKIATSISKTDLFALCQNNNISVCNIENAGHRVLSTSVNFISGYTFPYIKYPNTCTKDKIFLELSELPTVTERRKIND